MAKVICPKCQGQNKICILCNGHKVIHLDIIDLTNKKRGDNNVK